MDLSGSTALVTGAAVRIGRAICEALAGQGCEVVVHYNRSQKEAMELVGKLKRKGAKAHAVSGDLAVQGECDRVLEEASKKAGLINVLINNAAVFHKNAMDAVDLGDVLSELKVNYLAPVNMTLSFTRLLRENSDDTEPIAGKVVNLLDRRIVGTDPACLSYQISKKMLADFTTGMAARLAPSIAMNGVAPGPILPPPGRACRAEGVGDEYVKDLAGDVPLGRKGRPDDIASAVIFLLETNAITGQILFVDGGQHLREGMRAEA